MRWTFTRLTHCRFRKSSQPLSVRRGNGGYPLRSTEQVLTEDGTPYLDAEANEASRRAAAKTCLSFPPVDQ